MKQSTPKMEHPHPPKKEYHCEKCIYTTYDTRDFQRHLQTKKHNGISLKQGPSCLICPKCLKEFASRTSSWRHRKKCLESTTESPPKDSSYNSIDDSIDEPIIISVGEQSTLNDHKLYSPDDDELPRDWESLILLLVKENKELRNAIMQQTEESQKMRQEMFELAKKPTNVVNNNNQRISVVNYLNTECKDAMTLTEFVDSIELTMDDMYYTREHGYVKGMCNVLMRQIEGLKQSERPIHCTDQKRLRFFIKTTESWKRDDMHTHIQSAMTSITDKHIKLLNQWKKANPDWIERDDLRDEYFLLTSRIMGGEREGDVDKNQRAVIKTLGSVTELELGNNSNKSNIIFELD